MSVGFTDYTWFMNCTLGGLVKNGKIHNHIPEDDISKMDSIRSEFYQEAEFIQGQFLNHTSVEENLAQPKAIALLEQAFDVFGSHHVSSEVYWRLGKAYGELDVAPRADIDDAINRGNRLFAGEYGSLQNMYGVQK